MNLTHLFTMSRVVTAVYRIISTTLLLFYLGKKLREKKRMSRSRKSVIEAVDNWPPYGRFNHQPSYQ